MFSDATRQFILQHRLDDIRQLALKFHSDIDSGLDISTAIVQIAGRQAIEDKIPSWYEQNDLVYPRQLSLEQSSSELTAKYKASLLSGNTFADLTGGLGVDSAFISAQFQKATYVERQQDLCTIARHNFLVLGLNHLEVINEEAEDYLNRMDPVDCLFLDPARRASSGRKTVAISDCEPDVGLLKGELLKKATKAVMIKLSPMLDISLALKVLPDTFQVHVVSVDNECKELLFLMKNDWVGDPVITCVNLRKSGNHSPVVFTRQEEKNVLIEHTSLLQKYLYEPNTSILKAGAYKIIASRYGLKKLHPDSHLYTSSERTADFPGRVFSVQAVSSLNKKELQPLLQGLNQANITVRNFPMTVADLRKKLSLREGGDTYLFATTLADGQKVLVRTQKC